MNLPLSKLNRDELYTFIAGMSAALSWHLYFQEIHLIATNTAVIDSTFVFAWLFMTGIIYILYMIMMLILELISKLKIKAQDEDTELNKFQLTKYVSFFWAGPLEEQALWLHIFGVGTIALLLVYHPIVAFAARNIEPSQGILPLIGIHTAYSILTIAAYFMLSKTSHYLHQVKYFIDKGYCDTLDETTYRRERAIQYAKVANDIYLAHLNPQSRRSVAPGPKPHVTILRRVWEYVCSRL